MSKRTKWLLGIGAVLALVVGWQVVAFANLSGSNFQGNDGDLDPALPTGATGIDWNSFAPLTWSTTNPAAPYRLADETKTTGAAAGWHIVGKEDDQKSNTDTGFAGGTKQDDDCATVIGSSAPNKDDLKRAYLSTKVISGNTFLNLAWVRIPQNTTNASAHVGFEFNQSKVACPNVKGKPSPNVPRTSGDMLIVYDFEGSSTDTPTLTLRRWYDTGSNPGLPTFPGCEVSQDSRPCWGQATSLANFSEAKVNTSDVGSVDDALYPDATTQNPTETLGLNEFGEASINLSAALPSVFGPTACAPFGKAKVVSRSSGNSSQAAMEDLVGPVDFSLSNCGSVTIIKQTDPRGLDQAFSFTSSDGGTGALTGTCTSDSTPASFSLNDKNNSGKTQGSTAAAQNDSANTESCTGVTPGTYTVTEGANPSGFSLESISCNTGGTVDLANRKATITVSAGSNTTCLFTNKPNAASIATAQSFFPNDSATISGNVSGSTPSGSVTFELFGPDPTPNDTPSDDCTGTAKYTQTVNLDSAGKAKTTNGDGVNAATDPAPTDYAIVDGSTSEGKYWWKVSYSGDSIYPPTNSCVENSTVSITNS